MNYTCPNCRAKAHRDRTGLSCTSCSARYPLKNGILELTHSDAYWGEFSEQQMDEVLRRAADGDFGAARSYITHELGRGKFVFGSARSDFLYYFNLHQDATCLDVGCGLGVHSFNIAPHVGEVVGFDLSSKRVRFCAARAKAEQVENATFIHADFSDLPFSGPTFDFVLMNGVVEWLGERELHDNPRDDQVATLKQIRSLMKPAGTLYIGIENRWAYAYFGAGIDHSGLRYTSLAPRVIASWITAFFKKKPYRTYTYSLRGYRRLLRDSGFDPDQSEYYIAHPGYNKPQYIIPYGDVAAIRYFMRTMTKNKGALGALVRVLSRFDWFVKIARNLFYSFIIFARTS